ncbi:MAG: hypothetical protein R3Y50_04265 [Rikenellaceae bacterium]
MKRVKLMAATLFAACAVSVASAQTATEVSAKFNEAAAKYNAKDFTGAIPLFEESISMAESSSEDVIETLQNAQKFLVTSYLSEGVNLAKTNNLDGALEMFQKSYDLADMTGSMMAGRAQGMIANVYTAKGNALAKSEDYAGAAEEFNKSYTFDNKNTKAALLAAQFYNKAGNTEKSDEIYTQVIALGQTHSKYEAAATEAADAYATNYLVTASAAAADKNYAGVTENLDKIAAVAPDNAKALMLRVQAANNFQKVDDVIKYGEDAANAQTDEAAKSNVYFLVAAAYQTKENKAKAIEYYGKVTAGDNVQAAKDTAAALAK